MAPLNAEQVSAVSAPAGQACLVVAAAGTGKTTVMIERCRYLLEQGAAAKNLLVLTFSRKAAAEFEQRLRKVPGAAGAPVSTFHAWSWGVVRRFWAAAGFQQAPTIVTSEDQLLATMRDTLVWDRLAHLQGEMRSWLFLGPTAGWEEIVEAAAERHTGLYTQCLQAAVSTHNSDQPQGSCQALPAAEAMERLFCNLPARLQLLLLCELHSALSTKFGQQLHDVDMEGGSTAQAMLQAAAQQAPLFLSWLEAEKRRGRMPDAAAYATLLSGTGSTGENLSQGQGAHAEQLPPQQWQERQVQLLQVGSAFQEELRRLSLAALSDLPLLARRVLVGGGEPLEYARGRWQHVLVDEFQDTGACMLDLLVLLMGDSRQVTVMGDADQTIYSFLAANPAIFNDYTRHFGARQLSLQTNFRSTAAICSFASALLHGNCRETEKCMLPARAGACDPVTVRQFYTAEEEAAACADEVERLWQQEGVPYRDVCMLYRCMRLQGTEPHAPLMQELRRRGIPFVIAGKDRLADSEEVAALLSYLSLVANPSCDPAFEKVLGLPYHGLGQDIRSAVSSQRQAAKLAGSQAPSMLHCAEQLCSEAASVQAGSGAAGGKLSQPTPSQLSQIVSSLNHADVQELQRLVGLLKHMQATVGQEPLPQAVRRVLHESGLVAWLQQQQEGAGRAAAAGSQGPQGGPAAEVLSRPLQSVLQKVQQLATEWQNTHNTQQEAQVQQGKWLDEQAAASFGSQQQSEDHHHHHQQKQQQQGIELVKELLARLSTESAADNASSCAGPGAGVDANQQQQGQHEEGPGLLTISTIHAAKGLEWSIVFMPSVNEGALPVRFLAARSYGGGGGDGAAGQDVHSCRRAHLEEERRLFHVAATRARDRLLVSYVQPQPRQPLPEPGDDDWAMPLDGGQSLQVQQQAALQPALPIDPSELSFCSSILSSTVQRLRQQPGVLQFHGRLPKEDWPELAGVWAGGWGAAAADRDGRGEELGTQHGQHLSLNASGSTQQRWPLSQLSIAEWCRQQAAAAGASGIGGGHGKRVVLGAAVAKRMARKKPSVLPACANASTEPAAD